MHEISGLTPSRTRRDVDRRPPGDGGTVVPADMYATVPELLSRLLLAADEADWLDAFLLAAGACQVVEDLLQGTSWLPRRFLDHVGAGGGPAAQIALRSARGGLQVATRLTLTSPARNGLHRWCRHLSALTENLAGLVVTSDAPGARSSADGLRRDLRSAVTWLRDRSGTHRLLSGAVLRHPSCFASFDQHPDDMAELARRFAVRHPDRDRPLLVVGVRTSGSYLAPLVGAALRGLGYREVVIGTTRPGAAVLPGQGTTVRRIRAEAGLVLVLDDPPITGGSLAAVARQAEREGFPARAVVPLVATFDDTGTLPDALADYPGVLLPGRDWRVRDLLRPDVLEALVSGTLAGTQQLRRITVGEQGPLSRWAHLAVPITVEMEADGQPRTIAMRAEWTGVGYFGERSVTVAEALGDLVPRIYAFADGVLVRERLPGEERHARNAEGLPAGHVGIEEVARYIATRRDVLSLPEDRSGHLAGRQPVWEVAARITAPVLGRLGDVLRPPLVEPLMRAVLSTERPCLIDNRTTLDRWAADRREGWVKTDFAEGAFSHLDLASYDAAFDLARAAMSAPDDEDGLLTAYRRLSDGHITPARWCLLKLVHAWDVERLAAAGGAPAGAAEQARRAKARVLQQFLATAYLSGIQAGARGDWCVLDIDGVLETDVLGFSASSPLGMLSLRALRAHGYRVLLATGRPLPDLRDRCETYGLVGGVAEYGCVSYDAETGAVDILVPAGSREPADSALVRRLSEEPSVHLDPDYRWSVRASVGRGAGRTALPAETVRVLLADPAIGSCYSVVQGDAQTDFVPRGVDKAHGVSGLLERLGEPTAVPVSAVGDGDADVSLLKWAECGLAPRNAQRGVRAAGVPVLSGAYQAGLAEAVGRLIGHRPGGCPVCAPPRQDTETRALLALLAVPEAGRAGAPVRIARLARETFRVCSRPHPQTGRSAAAQDRRW